MKISQATTERQQDIYSYVSYALWSVSDYIGIEGILDFLYK